jgi:heavy metal sensor kinase
MLDSVRVRLTVWYAALLAVFLVVLALATYLIFWRSTLQRTDSNLSELSDAFLTTFYSELPDHQGTEAPRAAAEAAITEHRFREHAFVILDGAGRLLISSNELPSKSPEESVPAELLSSADFRRVVDASRSSERAFGNVPGGEPGYRGTARRFSAQGQSYTLVILQSLRAQQEMLEGVQETFAWVIPLAVVLASAGGYFLARKSLAPVVAMSTQAERIGAANLHERLPVHNPRDELGQLAASFNQLLERVAESFERQKRFVADASHELRTPVAILRGESEVALSRAERTATEYRESLSLVHSEARRLSRIVEDLFTLTRADAGQYPLEPRDFYLDELVADCVHATRALAQAKRITLSCDMIEDLPIHADEGLLRRLILNLLDNAIKYTPPCGSISVSSSRSVGEYSVSIKDTGPGIPGDLQPKIFERFFRVDKARAHSDANGGAGLGLSIARWIAEAHHGRLILTQSDSGGSTFTAFLPVSPGSPAE